MNETLGTLKCTNLKDSNMIDDYETLSRTVLDRASRVCCVILRKNSLSFEKALSSLALKRVE